MDQNWYTRRNITQIYYEWKYRNKFEEGATFLTHTVDYQ